MSGYIKYFENGGKSMSFVIKDDNILDKYNKIWDKIKEKLSIKVREFDGVIKTNFLGDEIPKEKIHYTCIACITIDSVMKMEKKLSASLLEECKYKVKKVQMSRFISAELESDSESESKSDTELMAKSESNSDSE